MKLSGGNLAAICVCILSFLLGRPAAAHHGPEEMIAQLSKKIEASGATPVLLYKRATEWRTLAKYDQAVADLEAAIELNPNFVMGMEVLSEVFLTIGAIENAMEMARVGIEKGSGRDRSGCWMALARAQRQVADLSGALESCNAAFKDFPAGDLDWYLIRGALQRQLGKHEQRVADFQQGYQANRSSVLRIAALEALIDAGRADEALPEIDEQVSKSRLKSSWLIRQGRALMALKKPNAAKLVFEQAVAELDKRIHPIRPDVSLLADRGFARVMLGDLAGGKTDYAEAQRLGASEWMLTLLHEALEGAEQKPTHRP